MKEKFIIVFIAVALGLLITTVGFLIYQSTKINPQKASSGPAPEVKKTASNDTSQNGGGFVVTEPKDESLTSTRTISVKGAASPGSTIVISTNNSDSVATPSSDGKFSTTVTIDAGVNKIISREIKSDGSVETDTRIVTYSTDDF